MGHLFLPSAQPNLSQKAKDYDGNWWLASNTDERSGFLNGAADCLTWAAHLSGFNGTPEQLETKISNFYKAHPSDKGLLVLDVWQRVTPKLRKPAPGGETWDNPHWYLDGSWWQSLSERAQSGYLEGYLSCMRTRVPRGAEAYSKPADYYVEKIDSYLNTHPKAQREAVANILSGFRDRSVAPK
jgi:hypothetical protein